ncbi:MAG: methyltransferase domain-containing protein [Pseudomonadota bacterium]
MTLLVSGPSNSGKSTYIKRRSISPVSFAHDLVNKDVPHSGVIHYNLLHYIINTDIGNSLALGLDIAEEPILKKILLSQNISHAIVIVAPIEELIERANERQIVEPSVGNPDLYPRGLWLELIRKVDLFSFYECFFRALDYYKIPFDVLFSSKEVGGFSTSDRVYVHHNLRGSFIPLPSDAAIDNTLGMLGAEYQDVLLPKGIRVKRKGFGHLSDSRTETFMKFRSGSYIGRSVLDIGCAIGEMLFLSERLGADRVIGIEMMYRRFNAAQSIAKILCSKATFKNEDFLNVSFTDQFDDVLALNVIHHVSDVRSFLIKAANLTKRRLIVEYPTLRDPKFQELGPFPDDLAHLPLMGVSSKHVDQTFVFTLPALVRMVSETGRFSVERCASPIPGREIAIFHRQSA